MILEWYYCWLCIVAVNRTLLLNDNLITGIFPVTISTTLTTLQYVFLGNGTFSEALFFPADKQCCDVVHCPADRMLSIANNRMAGTLSTLISELSQLTLLDVSNNALAGSMLAAVSAFTALSHLDLSNNSFTGSLPDMIPTTLTYVVP